MPLVCREEGGTKATDNTSEQEELKTNAVRLSGRASEQTALEDDEELRTIIDPPAGMTPGWLDDAASASEGSSPTQPDALEALPEKESTALPASPSGGASRWADDAKALQDATAPAAAASAPQPSDDPDVPTNVQRRPVLPPATADEPTPAPLQDPLPPSEISPAAKRGGPAGAELVGQELHGTYQPTRLIAKGSMSSVFEARHLRLPKKRLAIKMLNPTLENLPEAYARFRREAEIATELGNAHIVEVLDFNVTDDGHPYLVMEFLEGEDLAQRIERAAPLDLEEVAQIVEQVADGLQAAHDQGIVHRDMKPGNIHLLAGPEVKVKILDFGISKIKHTDSMVTHYNMIVGTPFFMSPEQARVSDATVDQTTDIFALASIGYQMLTGALPFDAPTLGGIMERISGSQPRPLRELNPAIPQGVQSAIDRAMAKDKAQRYQRVDLFAQQLCQALRWARPGQRPGLAKPAAVGPGAPAALTRPQSRPTSRQAPGPTQPILLSDLNVGGLLPPPAPAPYQKLRKQPLAYVQTSPHTIADAMKATTGLAEKATEETSPPTEALTAEPTPMDTSTAPQIGADGQSLAHQPTADALASPLKPDSSLAEQLASTDRHPAFPAGTAELPFSKTEPLDMVSTDSFQELQTFSAPPPATSRRQSKAPIIILALLLLLVGLSLLFLVVQRLRGDEAHRGQQLNAPRELPLADAPRRPLPIRASEGTFRLSPTRAYCSLSSRNRSTR